MTAMYKVRNRQTGLYSTGGLCPSWTQQGKMWASLRLLRSHLSQHISARTDMSEWEFVEYSVVEAKVSDLLGVVNPKTLIKVLKQ